MHGQADDTIPFFHGKQLFAAASSPKLSLWVQEATHNDFVWVAKEKYEKILQDFLRLINKN
jgi:abhydrolase domain-containing protein 17